MTANHFWSAAICTQLDTRRALLLPWSSGRAMEFSHQACHPCSPDHCTQGGSPQLPLPVTPHSTVWTLDHTAQWMLKEMLGWLDGVHLISRHAPSSFLPILLKYTTTLLADVYAASPPAARPHGAGAIVPSDDFQSIFPALSFFLLLPRLTTAVVSHQPINDVQMEGQAGTVNARVFIVSF